MNVDEGQLDRETAERLLDGDAATRDAGPVAELLIRAAAPGRAHELAREDAIVMAFRSARKRRFSWRRLFTFKFFGAFLAVATAGGLAFASSAGVIPMPGPFRADPPAAPTTGGAGRVDPTAPPQPSGAPTEEELHGMCNAYLGKAVQERGKALESVAFVRLVEAAGGADRVEAYCADLSAKQKEKEKDKDKPSKAPPDPTKGPGAAQSRRAQ